MNDRITISITPQLHSAIIIASIENDISISRTIENSLRESPYFKKFIDMAREYAESEENVNPSAVSSEYISNLKRDKGTTKIDDPRISLEE
jgi:hypothetical protein